MPACHCRFAGCNGKNRPPSTICYHRSKDIEAQLEAAGTIQPTLVPPTSYNHPAAVLVPPPQSFPSSSTCSPQTKDQSHASPPPLPDYPPSPSSPLLHPSQRATSLLEERGRRYIEEVSHTLQSSAQDELGDLDEDGDGDPELDNDNTLRDALAASRQSEPTRAEPPLNPATVNLHPILRDPSLPDENCPIPFLWTPHSPTQAPSHDTIPARLYSYCIFSSPGFTPTFTYPSSLAMQFSSSCFKF